MKTAVFGTKNYDEEFLNKANEKHGHELNFIPARLNLITAPLAAGFPAVCSFVNDDLSEDVLEILARGGTRLLALRSAGFNHVDLKAAEKLGFTVMRVPKYSPYAVAEHAVGLILTLNRKIHRAYNRVREGNFTLEGLLGFDMRGKTVGIIGTGNIGLVTAGIIKGFGCEILAHDKYPSPDAEKMGIKYVDLNELYRKSDIISLHCPLTPDTRYIVNRESIEKMKNGVMIINTSRGGLVDTSSVIEALKSGKIGSLGLDVYEEEGDLFFENLSDQVIQDDQLARLLTFPNVIITSHQAFFTREALSAIAEITLQNITDFENGTACANALTADRCLVKV